MKKEKKYVFKVKKIFSVLIWSELQRQERERERKKEKGLFE